MTHVNFFVKLIAGGEQQTGKVAMQFSKDTMLMVVVSGTQAPEKLERAFDQINVAIYTVQANDLTPEMVRAAPGCILTGSRKWPDTQTDVAVARVVEWVERYNVPTMATGQAHEAIASLFGGQLITALAGVRPPRISLVFEGGSATEAGLNGDYMVTSGREVIGAPIGWNPKIRTHGIFNRNPIEIMYRADGTDSIISVSFRPELSGAVGNKWIIGIATRCGLYKPPPAPTYTSWTSKPADRCIKALGKRTAAEWEQYLKRKHVFDDIPPQTTSNSRFTVIRDNDDADVDDLDFDLFGSDDDRALVLTPENCDRGESPPGFWEYGEHPNANESDNLL